MARVGYILVNSAGLDVTNDGAVLNTLSIRNLDTKIEITSIPLNPEDIYLKNQGSSYLMEIVGTCLSPDGQLFVATIYKAGAACYSRLYQIDPTDGTLTIRVSPMNTNHELMGIYADNDFVYVTFCNWYEVNYKRLKYKRVDWILDSTIILPVTAYHRFFGIGYDGINFWTSAVKGNPPTEYKIQKRNWETLAAITEYSYPIGYEAACFRLTRIDSQNPTHLWLQGELGTNGVIVVWDTSTQSIVSEFSSTEILRFKNQQLAPGGAATSTPGTIQFLSTGPFKKGNAIFDYLLSDAESDVHNVVSVQYSVDGLPPLIGGLPNPAKVWLDATIGTGGSGNTNLPSSPTGEYLKKAWDTITDTGTGDTLGVYFRLILEEI